MENIKQAPEKEKIVLKRNHEREERYDKVLEEVLLEQENVEQELHQANKHKKVDRVRI